MRRQREGAGESIAIALLCGIPLLLVGLVASAVSLFDAPGDRFERLAAGSVGVMGLVFGVGFLAMALPQRWGVAGKLWRSCGWLVALAIVPFALLLLVHPATAADHSSRIGSSAAAVVIAVGMLAMAAALARAWLRSVRSHRR